MEELSGALTTRIVRKEYDIMVVIVITQGVNKVLIKVRYIEREQLLDQQIILLQMSLHGR